MDAWKYEIYFTLIASLIREICNILYISFPKQSLLGNDLIETIG